MHTRNETLYIRGSVSDTSIDNIDLFLDGATINELQLECHDGMFEADLTLTAGKTSLSVQAFVNDQYIESGIIVYRDCAIACAVNSRDAIINTVEINLAHPIKIISGHTMVPLREYVMLFGGEIGWNDEKKQITVTIGRRESSVSLGSDVAVVDSSTVGCSPPVASIYGTAYAPSRLLANMLDGGVTWDGKIKTITTSVP